MSASDRPIKPRPRRPKGHRPYDLGEPQAERVLAVAMALAGEVAVLHERMDTIARLAAKQGVFSMADIESYQPDAETAAERDVWRKGYIRRILRIMEEALPDAQGAADYAALVEKIS